MSRRFLLPVFLFLLLAGCDQLGLEAASVTAARVEADGKAVGAACRHGGRAIEDCFTLNRKVDKAAIYAGGREMDDYMRENKIEAVPPELGPDGKARNDAADAGADDAKAGAKPAAADKGDKPAAKPGPKADRPAEHGAKAADKAAEAK